MTIKKSIKENGINQAELARAVGVSPAAINQFVNHNILPKRNPDKFINKIGEYFQALNITLPSDLFNSNENEEDSNMNKTLLTQKAKKLYGIFTDPFVDDIRADDDVFFTPDSLYVKENLHQAAKSGRLIGIVGESGSGKSVLRKGLVESVRDNQEVRIIMPSLPDRTKLTVASLIEAIIDELNPNAPSKRSLEAKSRQMERMLRDSSRAGMSHCLIIEEAHDLTIPMLKNLKRFWEIEDGGYKRILSIVLIGQPELKDKLNAQMNYEAREIIRRIEVVELDALDDYLYDYIMHKFKRINVDASKFITPDAVDALRARLTRTERGQKISDCYPLIINNYITHILNFGAEIGAPVIDAGVVKSA